MCRNRLGFTSMSLVVDSNSIMCRRNIQKMAQNSLKSVQCWLRLRSAGCTAPKPRMGCILGYVAQKLISEGT